ncbi:O-antigen ligase [Labedella gwakjiensis]|uniref:O-antigen ligase n=1 Tax=Labedella gwakjiensis TaxID=390269 RepID=A0A2P8GXV9_9MICO|nr:O-antigen ligase family protein [Labedella gwakjiensis]PSL38799.1 O-antigen ligase [Labedella gwakjiensis]RUQ86729.1 O-antigen ligase family protein [Labedella gwakjiensis]
MSAQTVSPPREQSSHAAVTSSVATLGLVVAFGGDGWRNLLGWPAYIVLVILVGAACGVVLVRARPRLRWTTTPKTLVAFLGLALLSLSWSAYIGATAATLVGTLLTTIVGCTLALALDWPAVVRALGRSLRFIIGLSLAFELVVALIVRHPVPRWWDPVGEDTALLNLWSRNVLLEGDRIQGWVGNANLLAIIALLGIVVFAVELAERSVSRRSGSIWLALAAVTFGLTRSSTMVIAAAACVVVLCAVLLARRAGPAGRLGVYGAGAVVGIAIVVVAVFFRDTALALFGKSSDLTGRLDIWADVSEMAARRPWFGWGYSSPWLPGAVPFDEPVIRNGVEQLQAHNAWLDVWMQLGVVGVVLFAGLVVSVLWRSWFLAVDRPRVGLIDDRPYSVASMLPLLVAVVLVVQSLMESRILVESGWVLLVALAVKTKTDPVIDRVDGAA